MATAMHFPIIYKRTKHFKIRPHFRNIFSMGGSWDVNEHGMPVSLIHVNKKADERGRMFLFNECEVEKYFMAKDVSDLKISVISVAGVMRAGKSFLLSFFLRYATFVYYLADVKSDKPRNESWIGNEETELCDGFKWRHAIKRETNGILMWPYLFKCKLPNDETVCILLLDTQGTHDGESSSALWSGVFAISTLISSLQLYNIMRCIGEEQLQNLELHCGYGKLIAETSAEETPYQNIMFVVRDFKYGQDYEYGLNGGAAYMQDQIHDMNQFSKQSQGVRKNIMRFFEQLSCCVLPDPGIKVMEQGDFNGKMKDIDKRFRGVVQKFIPQVLAPENLVLKRINGQFVTTRELFSYIKVWVETLNEASLPQTRTLFMNRALTDHIRAMEEALGVYIGKMEAIRCFDACYIETKKLEDTHRGAFDDALAHFLSKPKFGKGGEMTETFQKKLEGFMNSKYHEYVNMNKARVEILTNALRTPVTTSLVIGICSGLETLGFSRARWFRWIFYGVLIQWVTNVALGWIRRR